MVMRTLVKTSTDEREEGICRRCSRGTQGRPSEVSVRTRHVIFWEKISPSREESNWKGPGRGIPWCVWAAAWASGARAEECCRHTHLDKCEKIYLWGFHLVVIPGCKCPLKGRGFGKSLCIARRTVCCVRLERSGVDQWAWTERC